MSDTINITSPQYYKAVKNVREASEYLQEVAKKFEDQIVLLETKEESNANLQTEYAEKLRIVKVNLELDIRSNKLESYKAISKELGYTIVTEVDFKGMITKLGNTEKEVSKAVAIEKNKGERALKAVELRLESEAKLNEATNKAMITQQTREIEFLMGQLKESKDQVNLTRASAERMVEASNKSQVTLNQGK